MADQTTKPAGGDREQYAGVYAKIVAKTWADDNFRAALLATPGEVLSASGFALADYLEVEVLPGQTGAPTVRFPLPYKPPHVDAKSIEEYLTAARACCCC